MESTAAARTAPDLRPTGAAAPRTAASGSPIQQCHAEKQTARDHRFSGDAGGARRIRPGIPSVRSVCEPVRKPAAQAANPE